MYDDICACSELCDRFKKAEQARDLHFSAFIIIVVIIIVIVIIVVTGYH